MTDYKASRNRAHAMAFRVDAALLDRLSTVLAEVGKPLQYKVKFSDGDEVAYPNVEEVIQQPNTSSRSIVSITASTPGENEEFANVVLRNNPSPHVEYTVNGPQQRVVYFGSQLDQWVATIRKWYSPIFFSTVPALLGIAFAAYAPFFLWEHVASRFVPVAIIQGQTDSWIRSISIVGMWVAEFGATKLFPRAAFAIGQGANRDNNLKYVRGIIVAFVISVLAGMVANLLHR
jgi:hypothetical protein